MQSGVAVFVLDGIAFSAESTLPVSQRAVWTVVTELILRPVEHGEKMLQSGALGK